MIKLDATMNVLKAIREIDQKLKKGRKEKSADKRLFFTSPELVAFAISNGDPSTVAKGRYTFEYVDNFHAQIIARPKTKKQISWISVEKSTGVSKEAAKKIHKAIIEATDTIPAAGHSLELKWEDQ